MSYLGSWKIDDVLTFYAQTQVFTTGVATDADAVPDYRVYENETGTPLLTGSMALIDSANTAGFYSEAITLSAANGFEKGKCYSIWKTATVSGVVGAIFDTFQIEAEVDANVVSDKTGYSLAASQIFFKKNVAYSNFAFLMTDSTNHLPAAGLTVTATRKIDGGAFAACANAVTEVANGWYTINFASTDLNGTNVAFNFSAPGADLLAFSIVTQT